MFNKIAIKYSSFIILKVVYSRSSLSFSSINVNIYKRYLCDGEIIVSKFKLCRVGIKNIFYFIHFDLRSSDYLTINFKAYRLFTSHIYMTGVSTLFFYKKNAARGGVEKLNMGYRFTSLFADSGRRVNL